MWRNNRRSADDSFEKPDYENHSRSVRSPITASTAVPASVPSPRAGRFVEAEAMDEDYGDDER